MLPIAGGGGASWGWRWRWFGGLEVVVMVAYWYMWCPEGRGDGLLLVAATPWWQ